MQITKEYSKAYTEVLEIIKNLKAEEYKKIPKEKIEIYQKYKDTNYTFKLDETKELRNQITPKTKAILANLFIRYISTSEDREKIKKRRQKEIYEKQKQQEIKTQPIFQKEKIQNENKKTQKIKEKNETQLVEIKKTNIIKKIIQKIKNIFKIN